MIILKQGSDKAGARGKPESEARVGLGLSGAFPRPRGCGVRLVQGVHGSLRLAEFEAAVQSLTRQLQVGGHRGAASVQGSALDGEVDLGLDTGEIAVHLLQARVAMVE